jgi:hypothetical protein
MIEENNASIRRIELRTEPVHRIGDRAHHLMSRCEFLIGEPRGGGAVGGTHLREEGPGQFHAVGFVSQDRLAAVCGIGIAADVAGGDHAAHKIRHSGVRQPHALAKVSSGQRYTGRFADHDVEQRVKLRRGELAVSPCMSAKNRPIRSAWALMARSSAEIMDSICARSLEGPPRGFIWDCLVFGGVVLRLLKV